jgi:hypothetical protein
MRFRLRTWHRLWLLRPHDFPFGLLSCRRSYPLTLRLLLSLALSTFRPLSLDFLLPLLLLKLLHLSARVSIAAR